MHFVKTFSENPRRCVPRSNFCTHNSWSSFIIELFSNKIGCCLENPRKEKHGKDDDLTEEEEGETVALGVQTDLDVRLKFKS